MSGRRCLLAAATLAMAILATEGLMGQSVPLRVPLSQLPLQLPGWTGGAEPIPAGIAEKTHPDDVISRRYADPADHRVVLYVAYYGREASRAQVVAVCAACDILDTHAETLEIHGTSLTVNRVHARARDRAGVEEMIVYWFQSGGRAYQDPYRGKLEQLVRALRTRHSEGALIRITAPMAGGEQEAHASVVAFMKAVVPALGPYFHD